jgi:hypothetical protein
MGPHRRISGRGGLGKWSTAGALSQWARGPGNRAGTRYRGSSFAAKTVSNYRLFHAWIQHPYFLMPFGGPKVMFESAVNLR